MCLTRRASEHASEGLAKRALAFMVLAVAADAGGRGGDCDEEAECHENADQVIRVEAGHIPTLRKERHGATSGPDRE